MRELARRSGWRAAWFARDLLWARRVHRAADHRSVIAVLSVVSRLGDGWLWYPLLAALPFLAGANGLACARQMLFVGIANLAIYLLIKRLTCRARPFVHCSDIRACTRTLDRFSFPSGHTLHAVAFSIILAQYFPAMQWVLWPFVGLVAVSRIALGLHYPSDVVAGAAIGATVATLVINLF